MEPTLRGKLADERARVRLTGQISFASWTRYVIGAGWAILAMPLLSNVVTGDWSLFASNLIVAAPMVVLSLVAYHWLRRLGQREADRLWRLLAERLSAR